MKRVTFAISAVGIAISGYALPGRFADNSTDLASLSLKAGFLLLFICSFIVNGYSIVNYFKRRKYNGIRTIKQYYMQRSFR